MTMLRVPSNDSTKVSTRQIGRRGSSARWTPLQSVLLLFMCWILVPVHAITPRQVTTTGAFVHQPLHATIQQVTNPTSTNDDDSNNTNASARFVAANAIVEQNNNNNNKNGGMVTMDRLEASLSSLSTRDRSFARLLVTTCIRRLGQIDRVLDMCQTKKQQPTASSAKNKTKSRRLNATDRWVQAVLRIGAVQLLFLQTPHHAAVKETVDLLRHASSSSHVPPAKIRYVNAVLRRLAREGDQLVAQTDVTDNAAPWLVQEWTQAWGIDAARAAVQAAMTESPRCLTVKTTTTTTTADTVAAQQAKQMDVAGYFGSNNCKILPQGSLVVLDPPRGKVSDWPLYEQGEWWIQDVSATLPAIALHNALEQQRDGRTTRPPPSVVDLCAAPGGKTAQLINFGYKVTAVEVSKKRSKQLQGNLHRLGFDGGDKCQVVVADGTKWVPQKGTVTVDGVLIDAPCTATGTGSKRPDVLRKEADYQELLDTQYQLLCHAADHILAPGGILVYATCSLLKQESEDQIQKFLSREGVTQMEILPFEAEEILGFEECIDDQGCLRIIPGTQPSPGKMECNVDGFYVARLRRIN